MLENPQFRPQEVVSAQAPGTTPRHSTVFLTAQLTKQVTSCWKVCLEGDTATPRFCSLLNQPTVTKLILWARERSRLWECIREQNGFPGGAVVKNAPANAGDTGSSPGLGRSHMPRSNWAREPQLLSLCSRACGAQLLSPRATTTEACPSRAHAPQQEKPLQ